jgi:hypothetical protein
MKKQRRKLDRNRFCNNVVPSKEEINDFLFTSHSRSYRRRLEQDAKKGKTTSLIIYNKVHKNSILMP